MPYLWKAMKADLRSDHDNGPWKIGEWRKVADDPFHGFYASKNIIDAMCYTNMEILAKMEVRGKSKIKRNRQAWTEMRIVKAWEWKKEDSMALAVYAIKLIIENFEKKFPNDIDIRPWHMIETAKTLLKYPTEANKAAWFTAWFAWIFWLISSEFTAKFSWSTAWSASCSASRAAHQETLAKCHRWVVRRIKRLAPIEREE